MTKTKIGDMNDESVTKLPDRRQKVGISGSNKTGGIGTRIETG